MPAELRFDQATLAGFLLVLARLGGTLAFVPLPGVRGVPEMARAFLILALSVSLFPLWPRPSGPLTPGVMLLWMAGELLFGVSVGLVVAFLSDILSFAVQVFSTQAGFSYASSIDPTTEADSGVMQIVAQLAGNLLFFAAGVDRIVLKAFARSLETWPPGTLALSRPVAEAVVALGATMMELGLRLALPIVALLLLADLTLALLGRIQSQLQLLSLSFPVKMLGALVAFAALAPVMPLIYQSGVQRSLAVLARIVR